MRLLRECIEGRRKELRFFFEFWGILVRRLGNERGSSKED